MVEIESSRNMKVVAVKVTPQGVLVPRRLIRDWGDIQEVEIEQRADAIIIKPKANRTEELHAQIVSEMKAAGLIEDLPWAQPPAVTPEERARLAKRLSQGKPLSEIIIADRENGEERKLNDEGVRGRGHGRGRGVGSMGPV